MTDEPFTEKYPRLLAELGRVLCGRTRRLTAVVRRAPWYEDFDRVENEQGRAWPRVSAA